MRNPNNAPCYECEQRHPRCHAECPAYAAYAAVREEIREARIKRIPVGCFTDESIKRAERKAKYRRQK